MCIACEMGFWMAMEEPPPAPKRKPRKAKADDAFACDAPETKAEPRKRRAAVKARASTTSRKERARP